MVGEAIESVLAQSYRDFELIVVDDGSTDGHRVELAQFGSQLRLLSAKISGVSAARNLGVRQSRGRLICVSRFGRSLAPDKLKIQVALHGETLRKCKFARPRKFGFVTVSGSIPRIKHRKPSGDIF